MPVPDSAAPLLEVHGLEVQYLTQNGGSVIACDAIDLDVRRGEIIGIVGESGSGKSTLITAISRLERPPAVTSKGSILYTNDAGEQVDLLRLSGDELADRRWTEFSIVLQSSMNSLNPVARIRAQFADVMVRHEPKISRKEIEARTAELLSMVGIAPDRAAAFPHELSGGMRQRVAIALALACGARLLICDEPTTAVDVVVQKQILANLLELRDRLGFAVIFVTHDLALLLEFADRIAVMYAGKLVELATPADLYERPMHPYTVGLRDAFPSLSEPLKHRMGISGMPPHLAQLPTGCAFHPRCPLAFDLCSTTEPELGMREGRPVACHLFPLDRMELAG